MFTIHCVLLEYTTILSFHFPFHSFTDVYVEQHFPLLTLSLLHSHFFQSLVPTSLCPQQCLAHHNDKQNSHSNTRDPRDFHPRGPTQSSSSVRLQSSCEWGCRRRRRLRRHHHHHHHRHRHCTVHL